MAWPSDDLTTEHLDAGNADPSQARAEIYNAILKIKALLAEAVSANGVSTVVKRDANGDFAAGVIHSETALAVGDASDKVATTLHVANVGAAAYGAGSFGLASSPVKVTTNEQIYNKKKEILVARGGTLTVSFGLDCNGGGTLYGQIWKNDLAPVGIERSTTGTGSWSEDISVSPGDLVQIYAYATVGTSFPGVELFSIESNVTTTEQVII